MRALLWLKSCSWKAATSGEELVYWQKWFQSAWWCCMEWKKAVVHQTELCCGFVLWLSLWLLWGWNLSKELTIWLLRWGGGVWVISGKNIPQAGFQGKQILARKYLKKKIPTLTKISFKACKAGKNVTPLYSRKKILSPEAKSFVPLSKVKWSAPKVLGMFSYDQLQVETPFWLNLCEASYFQKSLLGF